MCISLRYHLGRRCISYRPCSGTYSASNGCIESKHTVFLGGNRRSSVVSCVACSRYTSVPSSLFGSLIQRGVSRSPLRLRKEGLPAKAGILSGLLLSRWDKLPLSSRGLTRMPVQRSSSPEAPVRTDPALRLERAQAGSIIPDHRQ